jgi:hypothetical protein
VDGELPGYVVLIGFPDPDRARAWYHSPGYQAILPFRVNNSDGAAALLAGVPDGYRAADHAAKMAAAQGLPAPG